MFRQSPLVKRFFGQTPFPASNPTVESETAAFRRKWSAVDGALVDKAVELAQNWTESMASFWERSTGAGVTPAEYARLYQKGLEDVADPWMASMTQ